jgi:Protein of unknown function (DUF3618)
MTKSKATDRRGTSVQNSGGTVPDQSSDPQEIKADIAATRAELGDTIADLKAKTDVKARAGKGVEAVKDRTMEAANQARETVWRRQTALAAIAIGALAALSVLGIRKRRTAKSNNRRSWPW